MSNEYIVPGVGIVDETSLLEAVLPGAGFVAETASTAVVFSGPVPSPVNGTAGVSFDLNLAQYFSGGTGALTYTLTTGSLAGSGLTLGSSTGHITGATPVQGTYSGLVVTAEDTVLDSEPTNSFTIEIGAAPSGDGPIIIIFD